MSFRHILRRYAAPSIVLLGAALALFAALRPAMQGRTEGPLAMDSRSAWMGELRVMTKLPGELPVVGLSWSQDGSRLAVSDHFGNRMVVWDVSTASLVFQLRKKIAFGKSIAF